MGGRVAIVQGLPCMFVTCLYPSKSMEVNTIFVANCTTQEVGKEPKKMTGPIKS